MPRHRDVPGINVMLQTGAEWNIFSIGWHHHSKDDVEMCQVRTALRFTIVGFVLLIGKFRVY